MEELKINGYPAYQATSDDVYEAWKNAETEEEKNVLANYFMTNRAQDFVPKKDETKDECFGRMFEDFVNGGMSNPEKVALRMGRSHRYLISEMFKVVRQFIKVLAEQYEQGRYDARDEWACKEAARYWETEPDYLKGCVN